MKTLHVVPGLEQYSNGIAVAVKAIADFQRTEGHEVDFIESVKFASSDQDVSGYTEVWVHSNWWPPTLRACWKVVRAGAPLVRMTHANLDPLRYHSKWFKKALVSPFERWLYRHTSRVVVTCDAEREWCRSWGVNCPFEVFDLKQLFDLSKHPVVSRAGSAGLKVLYLGRKHPLKGVAYLEQAVAELKDSRIELRIVSDHSGKELEADWQWAEVLCLPTLSENFGLVVAEALERGKLVVTTDGAPAWEEYFAAHPEKGVYIKGFREGTDAYRVSSLVSALSSLLVA